MKKNLKTYMIWYAKDGEEEYAVIRAYSEAGAEERFEKMYGFKVIEMHEMSTVDDSYLAYT